MRELLRGRPELILALLLAAVVLAVPAGDLLAFGVHDHVAVGMRDVAALHAGHSHSTPRGAHHCDLWMNPAEMPVTCEILPPVVVGRSTPRVLLALITLRPFRLFSPPRF